MKIFERLAHTRKQDTLIQKQDTMVEKVEEFTDINHPLQIEGKHFPIDESNSYVQLEVLMSEEKYSKISNSTNLALTGKTSSLS